MQVLLGSLNILLGIIFLIFPIIFIEFARPRDSVKACLMLLLGTFMILSSDSFRRDNILILIINSLIIVLLVMEVFRNRWTQLSEKEKKEFKTIAVIKSKLLLLLDALKLTFQKINLNLPKLHLLESNQTTKKWVRPEKKDINNSSEELNFNSSSLLVKTTNIPKKDIIKDKQI